MRLIDADALKAGFTGNFRSEYPTAFIKAVIDNAPTIDHVKHGRWEHLEMIGGVEYGNMHGECNLCHKVRIIDNYCPNCGAKMDLTDDDS